MLCCKVATRAGWACSRGHDDVTVTSRCYGDAKHARRRNYSLDASGSRQCGLVIGLNWKHARCTERVGDSRTRTSRKRQAAAHKLDSRPCSPCSSACRRISGPVNTLIVSQFEFTISQFVRIDIIMSLHVTDSRRCNRLSCQPIDNTCSQYIQTPCKLLAIPVSLPYSQLVTS